MSPPGLYLLRRLRGSEVVPPPGSPEWAGLDAWFNELALYALRLYLVVLPVLLVLAWPTDAFMLQGDPVRRMYMAEWRLGAVALLVPLAVLARRWRALERAPITAFVLTSCLGALWTSWCNGRLGGFDTPWPYYLYFAIGVVTPVPMQPRNRLLVVGGVAACIVIGFGLMHPENLAHPLMPDAMLFLFNIVMFNLLVGEVVWASAALHYFERARLREATTSLAELNRTLDQRVNEQTAELRDLGQHLVEAQEAERNRLAAELHDDLGQQLAAVRFLVSTAQRGEPAQVAAALPEIQELVGAASQSVRTLVGTLRPLMLEQLGLTAACASLVRTMGNNAGLGHDYSASGSLDDLPREVSVTVYRVLQEALTNVTKHAQATSFEVELTRTGAGVELLVRDDGRGFGVAPRARSDGGGMGLVGMRERARAVGGDLTLRQPTGGGAELVLNIPLMEAP